jgi:hypothetical protein
MDDSFGIESPPHHRKLVHRPPARYLVIIDEAGAAIARIFLASREQVAEVDAGSEEVALMTRGLVPARGALGSEWDGALQAHSAAERASADVYTIGP